MDARRHELHLALPSLLAAILAACGPVSRFEGDAEEDTTEDTTVVDSRTDTAEDTAGDPAEDPLEDLPVDTAVDILEDTVPDTTADTPLDTAVDTPVDTVVDTAPDTVIDTVADTAPDTTIDTVIDTAPDTTIDTVVDTRPDTTLDTIMDTGPDTVLDTTVDPVTDEGTVTPGTDCAHPVDLTSTTMWTGSLSSYSNMWTGGTGCRTASGREIWFTATVDPGEMLKVDEITSTDVVIHRVGSCGSTSCISSTDYIEGFSYLNGTTAPVAIILVVEAYYSYETGSVILTVINGPPPAGNTCASAIDITSLRSWSGDFQYFGDLWIGPSSCGSGDGSEVWFTADVPAGHIFTFEETTSTDVVIGLVSSCSASGCTDYWDFSESIAFYNSGSSTMRLTIVVESYYYESGSVSITAGNQLPFAGSMCTQAINVSSVSSWTGDFGDFVNLWDGGSSCGSADGTEAWFTAVVPSGYTFRLEETTTTDVVIERVAACTSTSCMGYWDFTEIFTYTNTALTSQTIYLIVESYFSSGGPIALTISNAP